MLEGAVHSSRPSLKAAGATKGRMIVSWTQVMDAATPSCRHFFVDVPTATEHLAGGMLTDLSLALDTQKDFKPGAQCSPWVLGWGYARPNSPGTTVSSFPRARLNWIVRLGKDFMNTSPQAALGGIEFNVTVLTTGFWPSYQARPEPGPLKIGRRTARRCRRPAFAQKCRRRGAAHCR